MRRPPSKRGYNAMHNIITDLCATRVTYLHARRASRAAQRNVMFLNFAVVAVGIATLVWSADLFIQGAASLARRFGMSPLLIGMTIVSLGTSAPEILVSATAAASGAGELAVGNAFGSNIANIGLVLGLTLIISPILVGRTTAFTDLPLLLMVVVLCGWLLKDGILSAVDASILLATLVFYLIRISRHLRRPSINDNPSEIQELTLSRAIVAFILGLAILIGSSRLLVWASVNIAEALGVSELVIGLTIVALGTSLPELAAAMVSALKGHADIAIGAVVGSNMFNLLIVLALPGFFSPLLLSIPDLQRDLGAVFITTAALAAFTWLGWRKDQDHAPLGRVAGCLFLSAYVFYCLWLYYDIQKV